MGYKPFYKSKTFIFNAGVALLTFVSANADIIQQGVSPDIAPKVVAGIAIANLILRGLSKDGITFKF